MPTCPQCGSNNSDTSTSCWKCYAPLGSGASAGAATPSAPATTSTPRAAAVPRPVSAPRSRSKGSPLPMIIVVLLLLGGGGAGGYYYWFIIRPGNPAKIAEEFIRAAIALDLAKLKQVTTSSTAQQIAQNEQKATSDPRFAQAKAMLQSMIKLDKIEPGTVTFTGDEAHVTLNITGTVSLMGMSQSNTSPATIILVKENGVWKVDPTKTKTQQAGSWQQGIQQMPNLFQQGGGIP